MSLSINHNLMAANAARNLNTHYGSLADSVRRLSSGLRIGTAADDAAGLAIRELMRADITTLNQGVRNANDAVSMLQTADGALQIIDEKLIRMKELAEQAATGTYNSDQRLMIDSEFQAMKSEIERIAISTEFNGVKMLCNDPANKIVISHGYIPAKSEKISNYDTWGDRTEFFLRNPDSITADARIDFAYGPVISDTVGYDGMQNWWAISDDIEDNKEFLSASAAAGGFEIHFDGSDRGDWRFSPETEAMIDSLGYEVVQIGGAITNYFFTLRSKTDPSKTFLLNSGSRGGGRIPRGEGSFNLMIYPEPTFRSGTDEYPDIQYIDNGAYSGMGIDLDGDGEIDIDLYSLRYGWNPQQWPYHGDFIFEATSEHEDLSYVTKIHFGTGNESAEDYYYIDSADCTAQGLGIEELAIQTQNSAQETLESLNSAIAVKDGARAYFGAMQNRLENTISNLMIQAENLQAAESRISDVDVAQEMTEFTRQQILTQSAVAMLGQANSLPQMALQLIQG